MNIVEAYVKIKGKLIVLISGLPGSGKTKLGKNISDLFKMKLIDTKKYYKKDYNITKTLPNGTKIINWDSDDAYDWEVINADINENSKNGVIVCGTAFPTDKLQFSPDHHIQIKLSKQNLLKRRMKHIEKYNKVDDIETTKSKQLSTTLQQMIFNNVTYPYFIDLTSRSHITKFINANEYVENPHYDDQIYDIVFEYLMDQVGKNINRQI